MNRNLIKGIGKIFLLIIISSFQVLFAQEKEWKKELSSDETIEVFSRVTSRIDETEKKLQVVEYKASTNANVDFEKCLNVLRNTSLHKHFLTDTEVSKTFKEITDNEWLIYYFIDSRWPMPNSDVVVRMKFKENKAKKEATFIGTSAANTYPDQDVRRMIYNDVSYTFREEDNGQVFIEIYAKITPVIKAPEWLIKAWFPDGPVDILKGIVRMAKK